MCTPQHLLGFKLKARQQERHAEVLKCDYIKACRYIRSCTSHHSLRADRFHKRPICQRFYRARDSHFLLRRRTSFEPFMFSPVDQTRDNEKDERTKPFLI